MTPRLMAMANAISGVELKPGWNEDAARAALKALIDFDGDLATPDEVEIFLRTVLEDE